MSRIVHLGIFLVSKTMTNYDISHVCNIPKKAPVSEIRREMLPSQVAKFRRVEVNGWAKAQRRKARRLPENMFSSTYAKTNLKADLADIEEARINSQAPGVNGISNRPADIAWHLARKISRALDTVLPRHISRLR